MRIHYRFFMADARFWYDRNLIEADGYVVKAASEIRMKLMKEGPVQ